MHVSLYCDMDLLVQSFLLMLSSQGPKDVTFVPCSLPCRTSVAQHGTTNWKYLKITVKKPYKNILVMLFLENDSF